MARKESTGKVWKISAFLPLYCPWVMPLRKRFPDRLPVAFRPFAGEALSSWISRAASVYGLSMTELLAEFCEWDRSAYEFMDIHLNATDSFALECLLGCETAQILACTISGTSPDLLPLWMNRVSPCWNMSEHRTGLKPGFRAAHCGYCLAEDLDSGGSQHVRLSWYCSVTTICPSHRIPLQQCCHNFMPVSQSCGQRGPYRVRLRCGSCAQFLDDFLSRADVFAAHRLPISKASFELPFPVNMYRGPPELRFRGVHFCNSFRIWFGP